MKPMISNAQAPLVRAVQGLLLAAVTYEAGPSIAIVVEAAVSIDWASATFVGQKHWLELRLEPIIEGRLAGFDQIDVDDGGSVISAPITEAALARALAKVIDAIGDVEIDVPGHFVADIAVAGTWQLDRNAVRLTVEALTLLAD